MSTPRRNHSFLPMILWLLAIGFVIVYWWVFTIIAVLVIGVKFAQAVHRQRVATLAAHQAEARELAARADAEHAQCMTGNLAGVYGQYPPAA